MTDSVCRRSYSPPPFPPTLQLPLSKELSASLLGHASPLLWRACVLDSVQLHSLFDHVIVAPLLALLDEDEKAKVGRGMKLHCMAFVFANRAPDCLFSKTVSSMLFKVAHFQLYSTCMLFIYG